ncbi:hydroxyacylglutathione hydrolase [Encephalitozoon hellem ATCC 50504]|uniref:hydroxyacylglutathione hydrolase n=1 Tax=Encephalitozoon hellem TaxID=27973 RepID=A0A9Q9FAV1_ENCHE|nr:hydroxyacylglutathione hydrolase [Encephalitozoon hellem ATCC 50504]AFM97808.1 hydroxyacylglutathione hydrolase [Encephalitozoon hellem ATCC 50504]UTX42580.1 hydroxyacylglutathione hydrolase [Encephalitozoon hellem]WEL38035.1 hydroxyacylglutathione hydrolase [Encephalitozoon hellem]|eukprot:XP_003886789.1 hydroxyacylglutathione hydrolase [Encephalitozoon hellem ATCC 50504]
MGIEVVSIVVGDNYMHLFYEGDAAFCIDACSPKVLLKALGINFKKRIYNEREILDMPEDMARRRRLVYLFTTHKHWDHSGGIPYIMENSPTTERISGFEGCVCKCGDKFYFGDVEIECLYTPCHTMDSFCYYVDGRFLATGDTLFFLGCGKFFEGTPTQMSHAIRKVRERVDHNAILLYGHDYNSQNIRFTEEFYPVPSRIKEMKFLRLRDEIEYNPFFNLGKILIGGSEEEMMGKLREKKNVFNKI